jgi:hypothetical protein
VIAKNKSAGSAAHSREALMSYHNSFFFRVTTTLSILLLISVGPLAVWSFGSDSFGPYASILDRLVFRIGVITLPTVGLIALISARRQYQQQHKLRAWSLCGGAIILVLLEAFELYLLQPMSIT